MSKLYNMRVREYASKERQLLNLADYSVTNDAIPLKQNWADRWYVLTKDFTTIMDEVVNFQVRPDDVIVNTFMKCGTTWMQETAWLLLNNLDFEGAKKAPIAVRSPYLDWSGVFTHIPNSVKAVDNAPSPRLIKTHLGPSLLPRQVWEKKTKIIFVARNVKDAVVSSYHFVKDLGAWNGTMDDYANDFMKDEMIFAPYLSRLVDYWRMRDEPNVFFTSYEEMKRDLTSVIQKLCNFLGRPELNAEELKKILDHLSFNKMKDNKQTNVTEEFKTAMAPALPVKDQFQFMRRGIIGSYKDEISEETQQKLDKWSADYFAQYNMKQEDIFGQV